MFRVINRTFLQLVVVTAATLSPVGVTRAQTTKPAAAEALSPAPAATPAMTWAETVEIIGAATEKGDVPTVAATLTRDAVVRSFETLEPAGARMLVDAAAGWKLLGAHAYEFPPPTLASDIAADVKASDLVPDEQKRKIIPYDDVEAARANSTAADWVAQSLGAARNHLVGVAVFWNLKTHRPMFVLVKGHRAGDTHVVKQAVYGDPMARRASAAARQ
jgi:hypothetical protein